MFLETVFRLDWEEAGTKLKPETRTGASNKGHGSTDTTQEGTAVANGRPVTPEGPRRRRQYSASMCLAMVFSWMLEVPSYIVPIFASRKNFSTG